MSTLLDAVKYITTALGLAKVIIELIMIKKSNCAPTKPVVTIS